METRAGRARLEVTQSSPRGGTDGYGGKTICRAGRRAARPEAASRRGVDGRLHDLLPVRGGAYGIEEMIPASGPGLSLVMLMVLPFVWALPFGLVASELGSVRPQEGGYYKWVQEALGEFWGFQAGWWRTISVYIDNTLYVILAGGYVASAVGPERHSGVRCSRRGSSSSSRTSTSAASETSASSARSCRSWSSSRSVWSRSSGSSNWNMNPFSPVHGARRDPRACRASPSPTGSRSSAPGSPSACGCTRATSPCPPSPASSRTPRSSPRPRSSSSRSSWPSTSSPRWRDWARSAAGTSGAPRRTRSAMRMWSPRPGAAASASSSSSSRSSPSVRSTTRTSPRARGGSSPWPTTTWLLRSW